MVSNPLIKYFQEAVKSALDISLLVVPFGIAAAVLDHVGILNQICWIFAPLMTPLGLPQEAAPAIAGTVFGNLYLGISMVRPLGLTPHQMTVFGCFAMLFHSIPLEAAIAHRLGVPIWRGVVVRFVLGLAAAALVHFVLPNHVVALPSQAKIDIAPPANSTLLQVVIDAGADSIRLAALLVVVVVGVSLLMKAAVSKLRGRADYYPPATMPLIGGISLGITYGASFILEEQHRLQKNRVAYRQIIAFLLLTHGIFEETAIFAIEGASIVPLLMLRLAAGAVAILISGWLLPHPPTGKKKP